MGTRYTKKNLGDPNWSKPNNYKIKQNDAIYDVEIVPNKGVKGDISAQPFNDKNAEDIENALVSLDDDLAFVEADYINNAEHALKQNITDNGLNTTNKTVVGAINEVKSEGEYHDLLQDDAIAIVNNKINALPMNGSLKNIRTSLVGIPTTFTNIDMFNTKQTVTNYQPLSLDYKGAANPEVILMKTIGDYTFDFAIEATHTNGTDTTIILEAWVDGILYDTATRTLVGGSNQINGVTGFFTYSKGTDTVPSEIYFRFRASQGNTSANKALINTNLLGNSAENAFTDTDHVTGTNLNEPTYNGQTTTFILNDIKGGVDTLEDTVVKSVDGVTPDEPGNVNVKHRIVSLVDLGIVDDDFTSLVGKECFAFIHQKAVERIGADKPILIRQRIDTTNSFPTFFAKMDADNSFYTGVAFAATIMHFEFNINVDGDNNNTFLDNSHNFAFIAPGKNNNSAYGTVDEDQEYTWMNDNEVNINSIELDIAPGVPQNIYFDKTMRRAEKINIHGWVDSAVNILQFNATTFNDAILGANRQKNDGTWYSHYNQLNSSSFYLAPFIEHWSTFESTLFNGYSNFICSTGSSVLETPGDSTTLQVSHSSRSTEAFNTLSSMRIAVASDGEYGLNGSLTIATNRKIKVSLTPFTLFQLIQSNQDEEIAHTLYDNQFVSELQKQEFETNGVTPLFHTLSEA